MKKLLLAIIGVLIAGSFISLAIRQAVHTKRNQKIQNIQIKLKDVQIDQANTNLDQLKLQLRDIKTGKLIDQSKIDELNKKIEEQQRIIEQAESDKQARAKQKADEAAKVAQAQATALGTTKAYAADNNFYKNFIYQHESGNNPASVNSIGCRGLGQACPGTKLPCGADYACQDAWFTNYAMQRYGSWENAWAFWSANRWW